MFRFLELQNAMVVSAMNDLVIILSEGPSRFCVVLFTIVDKR